jgi:hypothetical protein
MAQPASDAIFTASHPRQAALLQLLVDNGPLPASSVHGREGHQQELRKLMAPAGMEITIAAPPSRSVATCRLAAARGPRATAPSNGRVVFTLLSELLQIACGPTRRRRPVERPKRCIESGLSTISSGQKQLLNPRLRQLFSKSVSVAPYTLARFSWNQVVDDGRKGAACRTDS